ncbi:hypothetical protein IJG12_03900 [Candidatus Saccharibacteria bacterium]|nr:hypothetical protein [Candidatus Saccharibacteria bacterium]
MTDSKDVNPQPEDNNQLSEIPAQFSKLQRVFQAIAEVQNKYFANAKISSDYDKIAKTIQTSLLPTQELWIRLSEYLNGLKFDITTSQKPDADFAITLNKVISVYEIEDGTAKDISKIESIKDGASCLVSMSAEVEERNDADGIIYKNSANIEIMAEVSNIKENQKAILAEITSLKEGYSIPAKITSIGFIDNSHSTLEVDGKYIKFRGGIASVILYTFFSRKNFGKTHAYEVIDFYHRCNPTIGWFELSKKERRKFQNKVYQSVRNINNRFMEVMNRGDKLIIQSGKNTYILNPKLFK